MKRLFILLTLCSLTLTSCQSVESKAKSYAQKMVEADAAGNVEKFEKTYQEYHKWMETLSFEDKIKAEVAASSIIYGN